MKGQFLFRSSFFALMFFLAACTMIGTDYQCPTTPLPSGWQTAQDGKSSDLNRWWATFNDPALTAFLEASQKDNPSLAKAIAAIDKARANRASVGASFLPQFNASASATGSGSLKNDNSMTRTTSMGLDSSWEIDLFGKTRRAVESAAALQEAREADWHDVQVSLAAEVAGTYIDYRSCRIAQKYYEEQANSQAKTTALVNLSVKAGFTASADAFLAEASVANSRSKALAQKTECEALVKSLVALTGMEERMVRQRLGEDSASLPQPENLIVDSVPADLLRQRPDIVSAERTLASMNAQIGVAEAGRYPSLTLSSGVTVSAANSSAATAPWSFGPALNLPIFTGGKTTAAIRTAKADYTAALADYQYIVRKAVKEVEQALVRLDSMAQREKEATLSSDRYSAYLSAAEKSWRVGSTSLFDLETARREAINARISLLELQQNRLQQWITLYKAVGGGWMNANGGIVK
jgi:NodT family efflux transporter outer membrane factor (OMF) lipoprotein